LCRKNICYFHVLPRIVLPNGLGGVYINSAKLQIPELPTGIVCADIILHLFVKIRTLHPGWSIMCTGKIIRDNSSEAFP